VSNLQSFFVVIATVAAIFVPQFVGLYLSETRVGEAASA
jgi:hypothetical protein